VLNELKQTVPAMRADELKQALAKRVGDANADFKKFKKWHTDHGKDRDEYGKSIWNEFKQDLTNLQD